VRLEGVFTAVEDTTLRYLSERRLRTLRDLSAQATQAKTRVEVGDECMKVLAKNRYDLPFAGCYLYSEDQSTLTLASSFGISPSSYSSSSSSSSSSVLAAQVSALLSPQGETEGQQIFSSMSLAILAARRTKEYQIVDISNYSLESLPPWDEVPRKAIVLPLTIANKVVQEGKLLFLYSSSLFPPIPIYLGSGNLLSLLSRFRWKYECCQRFWCLGDGS
jgi:hypothetical protein